MITRLKKSNPAIKLGSPQGSFVCRSLKVAGNGLTSLQFLHDARNDSPDVPEEQSSPISTQSCQHTSSLGNSMLISGLEDHGAASTDLDDGTVSGAGEFEIAMSKASERLVGNSGSSVDSSV
jgi:hypothetical protein